MPFCRTVFIPFPQVFTSFSPREAFSFQILISWLSFQLSDWPPEHDNMKALSMVAVMPGYSHQWAIITNNINHYSRQECRKNVPDQTNRSWCVLITTKVWITILTWPSLCHLEDELFLIRKEFDLSIIFIDYFRQSYVITIRFVSYDDDDHPKYQKSWNDSIIVLGQFCC